MRSRLLKYAIAALPGLLAPLTWAQSADECQLSLSEPLIEFGASSRTRLLETANIAFAPDPSMVPLGKRTVTLRVTCPVSRPMTIVFRGSAADTQSYRLNHAGEQGHFTVRLSGAQLDGKPVRLGRIEQSSYNPDTVTDALMLVPERGAVPIDATSNQPAAGRNLSLQAELSAQANLPATRVTAQTQWKGEGYFELATP